MFMSHGAHAAPPAGQAERAPDNDQASLRTDLQRVTTQTIYFGHQSVGENLLSGVQALASQTAVNVKIAPAAQASQVPLASWGHHNVGENGMPLKKLQAFEQALGDKPSNVSTAMLKFCYLDIQPQTDVQALFSAYRSTMDRIHAKHPGLRIVHFTAPLTIVQTGPKAMLKALWGKAPYGAPENIQREAYNTLIRQHYAGKEPVFDLARIESTQTDGTPLQVSWKDKPVSALVPGYSDDGQHLNAVGQSRAARALVAVLANASPQGVGK
jgi:hypothetical protein